MKLRSLKVSLLILTLFCVSGCFSMLDVRPRGEEIRYSSYEDLYEETARECEEDPLLRAKSLSDCLKVMDFQQNASIQDFDDFLKTSGDDED